MSGRLTDSELKKIRRMNKPGKYADGHGLYIRVTPSGSMLWQVKVTRPRETIVSLGAYPGVGLATARRLLADIQDQIARGLQPNEVKRQMLVAAKAELQSTFESVARIWFEKKRDQWSPAYAAKEMGRLQKHVFPRVGKRPIKGLSVADMSALLDAVQALGTLETAHRINTTCQQIFRYAVALGAADRNPCDTLGSTLRKPLTRHMPALTDPNEVGAFLRAVRGYEGRNPVVGAALRLLPMVFLRSQELREATWTEIHFDTAEWRIPAARMKQGVHKKKYGEPHVVPLAPQALKILRELYEITGPDGFVFKGERAGRPISPNTLNVAFRTMGYNTKTQVTPHGFRATAKTLGLEVLDVRDEVIEAQLAHKVKDKLGRSYNRAEFLDPRRRFMAEYADYLQALELNVPALNQRSVAATDAPQATDPAKTNIKVPQQLTTTDIGSSGFEAES